MNPAPQNQPATDKRPPNRKPTRTNDEAMKRLDAEYWHTRYIATMDANATIQAKADLEIEILHDKIDLLEQQITNKDRVLKSRDNKIADLRKELQETRLKLNKCEADAAMQQEERVNAALGTADGKDLISDEVVNPIKHAERNLLESNLHKYRSLTGKPEEGSPAAMDGCSTYRMPKKGPTC